MRALLLVAIATPCFADPIHPRFTPLSDYIEKDDGIALVSYHGNVARDPKDETDRGKTIYKVVEIFRQPKNGKKLKKGELISASPRTFGEKTDRFLLAGSRFGWWPRRAFSREACLYLKDCPHPEDKGWLEYQFKHLRSKDPITLHHLMLELLRVPFEDFDGLKSKFDADLVRKRLIDAKTPEYHHMVYAQMLGLCGNKRDLPMLKKIIERPTQRQDISLAGVMFASLQLGGEPELKFLEDRVLVPKNETINGKERPISFSKKYAAMSAVATQHGSKRVSHKRLVQSFQIALKHNPDHAEWALQMLVDIKGWSALRDVAATFDRSQRQQVRLDAIRFILSLIDNDKDKKRLAAAEKVLAKMRKTHKKLVEQLELFRRRP